MVYVMSDIHGNMRRFNSIMEQINLQPEDTLYILGDVIDRHPDGIRILRKIMAMPNAKMLLGNHEYMMLNALGRPYDHGDVADEASLDYNLRLWYRNSGDVTHRYWKHIRKDLREEIIAYLHSLPLNIDIFVGEQRFKLVHGGPIEEYPNHGWKHPNSTHFAVWQRWKRLDALKIDYTMVFGHTPTIDYQYGCPMQIWKKGNFIGVDCGSGYPEDPLYDYAPFGRLACLRLDDMKEYYSEENFNYDDYND